MRRGGGQRRKVWISARGVMAVMCKGGREEVRVVLVFVLLERGGSMLRVDARKKRGRVKKGWVGGG